MERYKRSTRCRLRSIRSLSRVEAFVRVVGERRAGVRSLTTKEADLVLWVGYRSLIGSVDERSQLEIEALGVLDEWHVADTVIPGRDRGSAVAQDVLGHRGQDDHVLATVGHQDWHG